MERVGIAMGTEGVIRRDVGKTNSRKFGSIAFHFVHTSSVPIPKRIRRSLSAKLLTNPSKNYDWVRLGSSHRGDECF